MAQAQCNVGRQRVVDFRSSHRECASSELSMDARHREQRSAGRAHQAL